MTILPGTFCVSETEAAAIRAAYEQGGELSVAVELRRLESERLKAWLGEMLLERELLEARVAAVGSAQASQHEAGPSTAPAQPTALKTGKERLGEKATDEQRVDDCKVPFGCRTRERPTACP